MTMRTIIWKHISQSNEGLECNESLTKDLIIEEDSAIIMIRAIKMYVIKNFVAFLYDLAH